jgi:hypothetical protein
MEYSKALFCSHVHAKEFLRNLYKCWARALNKVRQPWARVSLFLAHFYKMTW